MSWKFVLKPWRVSFLFIFIQMHSASAKAPLDVEITLRSGEVLRCHFEYTGERISFSGESEALYRCQSKSGEKYVYFSGETYWKVAAINAAGLIKEVRSNGRLLFAKDLTGSPPQSGLFANYPALKNSSEFKLGGYLFPKPKESGRHPKDDVRTAFEFLEAEQKKMAFESERTYSVLNKKDFVTVELVPGTKTHCSRIPGQRLCHFLLCEPLEYLGKQFEPVLDFNLTGYFDSPTGPNDSIFLSNSQEAGPTFRPYRVYFEDMGREIDLFRFDFVEDKWAHEYPDPYASPAYLPGRYSIDESRKNNCHSEELDRRFRQYHDGIEKLANIVADRNLAILIQEFNGIFDKNVIEKDLLPLNACHLAGDTWTARALSAHGALSQIGNSISEGEAVELFHWIKDMKDIPHKHIADGCQARAYVIAHRLEQRGITAEKAWLFPSNSLRLPNGWAYHVAAAVKIRRQDGSETKVVLDPSLGDSPLEIPEWLSKMKVPSTRKVLETSWPPVTSSGIYNALILTYSNNAPLFPGDYAVDVDSQTAEERLAVAMKKNRDNIVNAAKK